MPVMSAIERGFCRSSPWRYFAKRRVLPWSLGDLKLTGQVLEIGGGSGAMADAMARSFPEASVTVTDVDDVMVRVASRRLREIANVRVLRADVTDLPYEAGSFDIVTSYLMLHHVIDWDDGLREAARVLRAGGIFVGYDLTDTRLARLTHRLDGSPHRLISAGEIREALAAAGFGDINVSTAARAHLMRFRATKLRD